MNTEKSSVRNVNRHGTPIGRPFRQQQRRPKHLRRSKPAAGHSDRHQRHGAQLISTGDSVVVNGQIGRAVIKNRGARVALHHTKPEVSIKIADCRLIACRPGHTIRCSAPSQQEHHPKNGTTNGTHIVI